MKNIGRKHLIIPDVQARPGVSLRHLPWIGNYIAEKRPDVIVCIGDFADMPSLSSYDKGKVAAEGKRVLKDIECAKQAMGTLVAPFQKLKGYKPEMVFTLGNHEERIDREAKNQPAFEGLIGTKNLGYEEYGWRVIPFLKVVSIDQIQYTHYFTSGLRGNPVSSAASILRERHASGVMGHQQVTDIAFHRKSGHIAIIAGVCNLHDEAYMSHQDNIYRRQVIVLHEVHKGTADPMFVSLDFLRRKYS